MIRTLEAPCWRLVHPDGTTDDQHFDTEQEAADARADSLGRPERLDAPCLLAACNGCGVEPEGDFLHTHYPDVDVAVTDLDAYDMVALGSDVWCEGCRTEPHAHVGDAASCDRCGAFEGEHEVNGALAVNPR